MIVRAAASVVEVWAPAKLNLSLEIRGKRSDGYHEIRTLMVPVSVYDTLLISPAEPAPPKANIPLTIHPVGRALARGAESPVPATADNTVLQAVVALCGEYDDPRAAALSVQLLKRIPAAAGLGGGSSDAAAALRAVAWLLGSLDLAEPDDERLHAAAAAVGSDVPFFLAGGAAICEGRGEVISPCPLPRMHFVIVKPQASLSTADVYQGCAAATARAPAESLAQALWRRDWKSVRAAFHNGLQPAAEKLCPELASFRAWFSTTDVVAHQLSGSGTSYFALCGSAAHARNIACKLRARNVGDVFTASSCL